MTSRLPSGRASASKAATLRNRMVATAHGRAAVVDGLPTAADADYWRRVSAGRTSRCASRAGP